VSDARRTILVVDDSATIRDFVKIYLMDFGCDFVEAESGERALKLARLMTLDLIIADVKMPEMDGFELVRRLRSDADIKSKGAPILLLTGEKAPMLRARCLSAGANAFLPKPIDTEKLRELARQMLNAGAATQRK
jgi:CheY-like chemotaxis protein